MFNEIEDSISCKFNNNFKPSLKNLTFIFKIGL
jgi:hypothetical protein